MRGQAPRFFVTSSFLQCAGTRSPRYKRNTSGAAGLRWPTAKSAFGRQGSMRLLIMNAGQANEAVFVLRSGATIVGRDEEAGIFIPNLSLSRRHARVDVTDDAVLVTD